MIGLSLSESTRAAALDGALSFSILLQNQRELAVRSAQSSVTGLLSAIRATPTNFSALFEAVDAATLGQTAADNRLRNPPWGPTSSATRNVLATALAQSLIDLVQDLRTRAQSAVSAATAARNQAANPSTERNLGDSLINSGDQLLNALLQLDAQNETLAASQLAAVRADLAGILADAQAHLATLQAQNPPPAQRIADTQAIILAAGALLTAADDAHAAATGTLARAAGEAPQSYQLNADTPPIAYLTTWGDSGSFSLTDENGGGILVSADGRVDTLPPSGEGWQFASDATFLLPDGTKITVSPGSPASVLATRGQQSLSIGPLAPGQLPALTLDRNNGLAADASRNDGYVFSLGAGLGQWTLAGAPLGDTPGAREVVATTPLAHEHPVDVTNTDIPADLIAALAAFGLDIATFDTDRDGKLNKVEWAALVKALETTVDAVQARFDQTLGASNAALEALLKLNQFIEKILDESDRRQASRQQVSAEEREQLRVIQRDLVSALEILRQAEAALPSTQPAPAADTLTLARVVLNRLDPAVVVPPPPVPQSSPAPLPAEGPAVSADLAVQPPAPGPATPAPASENILSDEDAIKSAPPSSLSPALPAAASAPVAPAPEAKGGPASGLNDDTAALLGTLRRAALLLGRPLASSPEPLPASIVPPAADATSKVAATPPLSVPSAPEPRAPLPTPPAFAAVSAPQVPVESPPAPRSPTEDFSDRRVERRARYQDQLVRSENLQSAVRHTIERFLNLVLGDDELRQVFHADDLSDAQRDTLKQKTENLERELGLTWGGDLGKTPQADASLATRMLTSGMKI